MEVVEPSGLEVFELQAKLKIDGVTYSTLEIDRDTINAKGKEWTLLTIEKSSIQSVRIGKRRKYGAEYLAMGILLATAGLLLVLTGFETVNLSMIMTAIPPLGVGAAMLIGWSDTSFVLDIQLMGHIKTIDAEPPTLKDIYDALTKE